jgi:Fe-S cluster assembly protein SufD
MTIARDALCRLQAERADALGDTLPAPALAARLDASRAEALGAFEAMDIPTRRLERWKGTSLAALEAMDFARIGPAPNASAPLAADDADADLLFVDGRLLTPSATRVDLAEGVRVLGLAEAATEMPELLERHLARLGEPKSDSLLALQTALFEDVAVIALAKRARAQRPIRIRSLATGKAGDAASASFPRLLVAADRESEATILLESGTRGAAPGLTVLASEIHIGAGARIEQIEIQDGSPERIHVTNTQVRLEQDARFDSHVLSLGHGLVRSELAVALSAPGAETRMRGFFLGHGESHVDHFTTVDHEAPHCSSDEEYRGVLADASKGVFRGRVIVRPDAQKTDARQSNPNLLLSDRATIDTKPQLEIYADDVRASHGSTIGQLDPEALFFLRARGIDERLGRIVLTRAFAHAIVDGISDSGLRDTIRERVDETLVRLEESGEVSA